MSNLDELELYRIKDRYYFNTIYNGKGFTFRDLLILVDSGVNDDITHVIMSKITNYNKTSKDLLDYICKNFTCAYDKHYISYLINLYEHEFYTINDIIDLTAYKSTAAVYNMLANNGCNIRRSGSKNPGKEILYDLYINKRLTQHEIAKKYQVYDATVNRWIKGFNINKSMRYQYK